MQGRAAEPTVHAVSPSPIEARRPGALTIARAVVRKEIRDLARNRTLLVSLFAPVILAVLFVQVMEQARSTPVVRIALIQGSDAQTHTLLSLTGVFLVIDADSPARAREQVENGAVDAALLLPSDFGDRLLQGTSPSVTLVVRQDASPRTASAVTALTELLRVRAGQRSPVAMSLEPVGQDARRVSRGQWILGFVVFQLMMGFGIVATALVEERERGTMQAIRVTGVSPGAVLAGKAWIVWALCLAAALAMIELSGLHPPALAGLLAVMATGCGFAVALGLWMGMLFPNLAAANAGLPIVFLVVFVPALLDSQVRWAERLVWLPGHWLMQGLKQVLVDAKGLDAVWGAALVLGGYAVVCAAASWVMLARRV